MGGIRRQKNLRSDRVNSPFCRIQKRIGEKLHKSEMCGIYGMYNENLEDTTIDRALGIWHHGIRRLRKFLFVSLFAYPFLLSNYCYTIVTKPTISLKTVLFRL